MRAVERALFLASLFVGLPGVVAADNVYLDDGAVVRGGDAIVDSDRVVLEVEGGKLTIPKQGVVRVEDSESDVARFKKRYARLSPRDIAGRLALADWCRDRKMRRREAELLREILALAPNHAAARDRLGYVRAGSGWITRDEHNRRRGLVKVSGHWMTPEQASKARGRELEARRAELQREVAEAQLKVAEARAIEAEADARTAQAKAEAETPGREQPAEADRPVTRWVGGFFDPDHHHRRLHVHFDECADDRCRDARRPQRREPFWMPHVKDPRAGFPRP